MCFSFTCVGNPNALRSFSFRRLSLSLFSSSSLDLDLQGKKNLLIKIKFWESVAGTSVKKDSNKHMATGLYWSIFHCFATQYTNSNYLHDRVSITSNSYHVFSHFQVSKWLNSHRSSLNWDYQWAMITHCEAVKVILMAMGRPQWKISWHASSFIVMEA